MRLLRATILLALLSACGDDTNSGTGGGGGATASSSDVTSSSDAASTGALASSSSSGGDEGGAPPVAAEGTCEFTVDGETYVASGFGAIVTGDAASWSLQCQVSEDQIGRTVGMAANGFEQPGVYTVPSLSEQGVAAYTEQGVDGGTAPLEQYRTDAEWTLRITSTDATTLVGSASFTGVLGGKPDKVVDVSFNVTRL